MEGLKGEINKFNWREWRCRRQHKNYIKFSKDFETTEELLNNSAVVRGSAIMLIQFVIQWLNLQGQNTKNNNLRLQA